jgi:hypothetical protein
MNRRICAASAVASLVMCACNVDKSSNPLTPTVSGPIPGVAITAPTIVQPVGGVRVRSDQQVTFTLANATTSGVRPLWYVIEVTSDQSFGSVVYTSEHITPGDGQTVFRVSAPFPSDRHYMWRARAEDGANTGPNSAVADFNLFTPAVFQPPTLIEPINNNTVSSLRPIFKWRNADRTGSPDAVNYTVEVSDSASFTNTASAIVGEQDGQTVTQPTQDLPYDRQVFWRVRAFDSVSTGPWAISTFKTVAAPVPPSSGGGTGCGYPGHPSTWSTGLWHDCFFSLIAQRGVGPTVSISAIWALRGDLNAMGADWQNAWRGDPRPRIFLPVPNCPPATSPNVPECSYTRTVDVGDFGGAWLWIPR